MKKSAILFLGFSLISSQVFAANVTVTKKGGKIYSPAKTEKGYEQDPRAAQRYVAASKRSYADGPEIDRAESGIYVGADMIGIDVRMHDKCKTKGCQEPAAKLMKKQRMSFGTAVGYRAMVDDNLFISPEVFYDRFGFQTKGFYNRNSPAYAGDKINLDYRYGGRVNFGYRFYNGLSFFANYGAAAVNYDTSFSGPSSDYLSKRDKTKIAQIYGAGITFDINSYIAVKAAYDRQDFKIRYARDLENGINHQAKVAINVYRMGLILRF